MKKSERIQQELLFLRDKHHFQLKDLMSTFSISKRTALRDIKELENIGLALYADNRRHGGYHLIHQQPLLPIYFNSEEIQAIFFALKALVVVSDTPFKKSYADIRYKLLATLPKAQKESINNMLKVVHYYNVPSIHSLPHLDILLSAILNEKIIRLNYTQFQDVTIFIQMNELFYRNGLWFVSALDILADTWGTYRCDYMTQVTLESEQLSVSWQELNQRQADYEQHYHDTAFRCRLTAAGKERFLKNNYPNMRLVEENNIFYIVGGYNQDELDYMVDYIISFGKNITIESPVELKNQYLKQLTTIFERYT